MKLEDINFPDDKAVFFEIDENDNVVDYREVDPGPVLLFRWTPKPCEVCGKEATYHSGEGGTGVSHEYCEEHEPEDGFFKVHRL